jgi:hypothetical protein
MQLAWASTGLIKARPLFVRCGHKTKQVLPHTPQAIAEYFSNLRARYRGQQIAVGLEQSRGPLSRLLVVMGTKRDQWTTAQELACLSGIAPVIERVSST